MQDSSEDFQLVPMPELPLSLTSQANQHIRQFCVSMVVVERDERDGIPCGGVLCIIEGSAGILTARHVWESLSRAKMLVLMLGPEHPFRVERSLLHSYAPAGSRQAELAEAMAPDIAFIPLPNEVKTSIEARQKAFYSVDRRRSGAKFDLYGDAGYWVAVGSPEAMMQRDGGAVGTLNFLTDVDRTAECDGWDYLFVNLNLESNLRAPQNMKGMSGGGIWRVRFTINKDTKQFSISSPGEDILLQGITFFQTTLEGRQLIAHGPRSIYEHMPLFLNAQAGAA